MDTTNTFAMFQFQPGSIKGFNFNGEIISVLRFNSSLVLLKVGLHQALDHHFRAFQFQPGSIKGGHSSRRTPGGCIHVSIPAWFY